MPSSPKISFCIPTYNHAQFLGEALDSILTQAPEAFEIVIVDGASTDSTPEVVAAYQARTSQIVYRRIAVNRGVDPDIAEAVALAQGEYCWLMSSDDVLIAGAVPLVIRALETRASLYLGGRKDCTKELVAFGEEAAFRSRTPRAWNFSKEAELIDYLENANGLIALFSYISVLIFRRDLWASRTVRTECFGSCYAHAQHLWSAVSRHAQVEYVGALLTMCRMDTDHFASRGVFRRFLLDFDGYLHVVQDVFDSRPLVRRAFLGALRREHGVFRLGKFYRSCIDAEQRRVGMSRIRQVGYSEMQILTMLIIARTGPLVEIAVAVRRQMRRSFGRVRFHR